VAPHELRRSNGRGWSRPRRKTAAPLPGSLEFGARRGAAVLVATGGLPLLTLVLVQFRGSLSLASYLLLFLFVVVGVALLGGRVTAVLAAVAASLLINWFFTPPYYTFTIEEPQNLLALLVFLVVAVAVSTFVELAARRGAEAARSSAEAERLAEGNRMRTALLAAISHDLRTPLASIKAAVSSLRQGDVAWSAADEAELLAMIEGSADALDRLIGNLLDMSRLQTHTLEPSLRPVSLDEVVPTALAAVEDGDRITIDVPESTPLVIADAGLLERVVANLAANALRFSPPQVRPLVRARYDADAVHLDVVDAGPGIAPANRERVFEPFQRLDDRGRGTGVGLGLAVARGFAEAMGGTLRPDETASGGLTMTITLRRVRERELDRSVAEAGRSA